MSVLVAASGGMLLGAADYKLGDLFVTKGTIGKFAFQSAVQSFQDSFTRNIVNLSTVAIGAQASLGHDVPRCRGTGALGMAKAKTSASAYSCCYSAFRDWLASLLFRQKAEESLDVNQSSLGSFGVAAG